MQHKPPFITTLLFTLFLGDVSPKPPYLYLGHVCLTHSRFVFFNQGFSTSTHIKTQSPAQMWLGSGSNIFWPHTCLATTSISATSTSYLTTSASGLTALAMDFARFMVTLACFP